MEFTPCKLLDRMDLKSGIKKEFSAHKNSRQIKHLEVL